MKERSQIVKECHNEIVEVLKKYDLNVIEGIGTLHFIAYLISIQNQKETGV